MTKSERATIQADIDAMVAEAATVAKTAGNMPGALQSLVDTMLAPKVDWREQLRLFVERITKDDYNWSMPSRRYIPHGLYLPALYDRNIGTIVVAIDTSGSVNDKCLSQFGSELSAMLEVVNCDRIILLQCDSQIQKIDEYTKEDLPLQMQAHGRGGTYFRPVFEWVEENQIEPACLIYQTDLYPNDAWPEIPEYPVMWVAADANPHDPPFGEVIRIDEL